MTMVRYLWGLFALVCLVPGVGMAQLCGAECVELQAVGAATVQDQETGESTMYDSCRLVECAILEGGGGACADAAGEVTVTWQCCQNSTIHGWGSFEASRCEVLDPDDVIVYGVEGGQPAPIPEPGEPSWSLLDWLGDLLLVDWSTEPDLRGIVLVDLYPEWQTRPRGGWVFSDAEAPEPTPTYPPDPTPAGECGDSGYTWVCPKSMPYPEGCICMGPDGRAPKLVDGGGNIEWISPREGGRPTLQEFAALLEAWGVMDTEDGADDPTPTLDDPSEKLIEQIGWRTTEDPCVTEVIDQPVSVQDEDGSGAAYLGGCEIVTCPGAEPVTTCCTGESLSGNVTCQVVDQSSELYPYEPHTSIWEALEWLLTLPGSGEVPAGYEGPWKFYMFVSATEGR